MTSPPDPSTNIFPRPGVRVMVTGLTGQDGYYLSRYLMERGCFVTATARPCDNGAVQEIATDLEGIQIVQFDLEDQRGVDQAIERIRPEVIYHLAAQSSVARAWTNPAATAQVNALGTLHLLEAVRNHSPEAAFVLAGSCDCFDHEGTGAEGVVPETPLMATNPYSASKIMAQQLTQCYRRQYGLRASVAILFNHTSPRRLRMFVERGVVRSAVEVAMGRAETVVVGDLKTQRDWSWAPELMEAFAAMGALEKPEDLVLASGGVLTVGDWVEEGCAQLELDPNRCVQVDPGRLHGGDRPNTFGNIDRTRRRLGWNPKVGLAEMVRLMIEFDRADLTDKPLEPHR